MSVRSFIAFSLAMALLVGGCLPTWEIKESFKLNPDGSGKVAFDVINNGVVDTGFGAMAGGEEESEDPNEIALTAVTKMLHKAKGVDALADLSYEVVKDGRIRLKGVAYFPNYSKLSFPWSKEMEFFTVGDKGLELGPAAAEGPASRPAPTTQPDEQLTPEDKARKILHGRMEYQRIRPLLVAAMDGMKMDVTYYLPGKVESPWLFKKTDDGGLRYVINGRKMLEGLDAAMMDDNLAASPLAGLDKQSLERREQILKLMYGPGPYTPLKITWQRKPLFDYAGETTKAKQAMGKMLEKLKIKLDSSALKAAPMNLDEGPAAGSLF